MSEGVPTLVRSKLDDEIATLEGRVQEVKIEGHPIFKFFQGAIIRRKLGRLQFLRDCDLTEQWLAMFKKSTIRYEIQPGVVQLDGIRYRISYSGNRRTDMIASDGQYAIKLLPMKDSGPIADKPAIELFWGHFACGIGSFQDCALYVRQPELGFSDFHIGWAGHPLDEWPECLSAAREVLYQVVELAGLKK